jgi:hypothetical protein
LTWVGDKLRPAAIERLLLGHAGKHAARPWLRARMPAFPARAAALAAGLAMQHGHAPTDPPSTEPDAAKAEIGARLAGTSGLACNACHAVGATPPLQVFEVQGINFAAVADRLRRPYYDRWMRNPQRIDPGSKMTRYASASGKTALVEVLGGSADAQFEAIWHYLHTLR